MIKLTKKKYFNNIRLENNFKIKNNDCRNKKKVHKETRFKTQNRC